MEKEGQEIEMSLEIPIGDETLLIQMMYVDESTFVLKTKDCYWDLLEGIGKWLRKNEGITEASYNRFIKERANNFYENFKKIDNLFEPSMQTFNILSDFEVKFGPESSFDIDKAIQSSESPCIENFRANGCNNFFKTTVAPVTVEKSTTNNFFLILSRKGVLKKWSLSQKCPIKDYGQIIDETI